MRWGDRMAIYFEGPYLMMAGMILLFILLIMKVKVKVNSYYILFWSLFYIYMCMVAKHTLFPIRLVSELSDREEVIKMLNLIPFQNNSLENAILNVILTAPFGFLLPLIKNITKKRQVLLWAILFPVIIEGTQFVLNYSTGVAERIVDINDIVFNFLGVISGYGIYLVFVHFLKRSINPEGIFKYIIQRNSV